MQGFFSALKKVCIYWTDINNFAYFLFVVFSMTILQVQSKAKCFYSFALFKSSEIPFYNWTAFSEAVNRGLGALFLTQPSKYATLNGCVY